MDSRIEQFCEWYGDGMDGASPTRAQWIEVLKREPEAPIVLINFFKLRPQAEYGADHDGAADAGSGQDAFDRYAAVSMPTMHRLGGEFLHVGPEAGTFIGTDEAWDMVAIGRYPNLEAFTSLYADPAYREAFRHRTAACARQQVVLCGAPAL